MTDKTWLVLTVQVASADEAALAADALVGIGAEAVEERDGAVVTWMDPHGDVEALVASARRALADAGFSHDSLGARAEAPADWNALWRRGLRPRRVGERIIVAPSWTAAEARADDIVIVLDPEMAFGTGEHATTRGSLRLTEACVRPGDRVLDVGTGSAILAIAAARLGAAEVLAVDSDADALINARDNVARNVHDDRVRLVCALVDADFLRRERGDGFDVILANVLSGVLEPLLAAFRDALRGGGRLVLSGILDVEAEHMIAAARAAGFMLEREELEDEWWSGQFRLP